MAALILRLLLLAAGLGLAEIGLDSLTRGGDAALIQIGLALVFLVAGSAGFMVPLLAGGVRKEVDHG